MILSPCLSPAASAGDASSTLPTYWPTRPFSACRLKPKPSKSGHFWMWHNLGAGISSADDIPIVASSFLSDDTESTNSQRQRRTDCSKHLTLDLVRPVSPSYFLPAPPFLTCCFSLLLRRRLVRCFIRDSRLALQSLSIDANQNYLNITLKSKLLD